MDLSRIEKKLANLQSKNRTQEKVDYEKVFWRPEPGKHVIRIVPSAKDPEYPFTEMQFHYGIGKFPMAALTNFGKQDPIVDFVTELRNSTDKEDWQLAGKLQPKTRIFAPVIVRGEEDKGVRLWGFGKKIYQSLLSLAADEDVGDYTDVVNGFDLVVEQTPGNPYPETTVHIKPKPKPLSEDKKQLESWLKEQPVPLESYTEYDYDFVKKQLTAYIEGVDPDEVTEEQAAEEADSKPEPAKKDTTSASVGTKKGGGATTPAKNSVADEFDELFEED